MTEPRFKTIYIGFHDGQEFGEKPTFHFEPLPLKLDITHNQAIFIVNHLYADLKKMTQGLSDSKEDRGAWPQ